MTTKLQHVSRKALDSWLERKQDILKIGGAVALLALFLIVVIATFSSGSASHTGNTVQAADKLAVQLEKTGAADAAGAGVGAGAGPPLTASVLSPSDDDPDADASALAAVAAAAAKVSDLEVEDEESTNDDATPVVSPAVAAGLPPASASSSQSQENPAMPALISNPLQADSEMRDLLPPQPASVIAPLDANKETPSSEMPELTKPVSAGTDPSAMPAPATVIQLTPVDPAASAAASDPAPTALDVNPFGAAARSRISRISRVVEPADLMRMKLNAGATDASAVAASPAASAPATAASTEPAPSVEDAMDSLEQSALDRWSSTNYTARMAKFPAGHVDQEGRWVAGAFPMLPRGWDAASMRNLVMVWDFGGGGCSGWGVEASNMVLSLAPYIGKIGIIAGKDTWCKGLPAAWLTQLEAMRTAPINEWGSVDVWVSHKPPQRYPTFPYRGVVRVAASPHFVIGRSMSEIHKIPRDWTQAIRTLVDEVWVPSHNSLEAFTKGGANPLAMRVIPEPIDPLLYDPFSTQPLPRTQLPPQRSFNWLSIFKLEERKGWKILVEAWMREFSEKDDVTLNLHTYLFAESSEARRRSPKRIREVLEDFVGTLDFGTRDMEARPLPWANLNILSTELDTTLMPRLYKSMQGFVLPTHGEGWGMPLMEAMAMGLPTLATNWGGQLEFMHQGNSYLIPVEKFERADPQFFPSSAKWATASGEALQRAMRHVVAHPDHAVPIGARARSGVLTKFNSQAVAARMLRRLQEIYPIILERRAAVLEGRKVVRASHLLTSLSPVAAAAPVNEGMLARRGGDSLAEAKQADSAREARELDEAVALSIKTGWQQTPEEAAADAAELVAMAHAAMPALKAAAEAEQREQQQREQAQEQDQEPLEASIATPRASARPSDDQTNSMNDPFPAGASLSAEITSNDASPASEAAADGDSAKAVPLEAGIENDVTEALEAQADGDWRARMKKRMEAEADAAVDAADSTNSSNLAPSASPPFVAGSITPPASSHADTESVSPSVEVNPSRSTSSSSSRSTQPKRKSKSRSAKQKKKRSAKRKKSRADLQALKAKYAAAAAAAAAELESLAEGGSDSAAEVEEDAGAEVEPIMDPKPTLDPRQQYEQRQQQQAKKGEAEVVYDEEPQQTAEEAQEAEQQPKQQQHSRHSRSRRPQREEREE